MRFAKVFLIMKPKLFKCYQLGAIHINHFPLICMRITDSEFREAGSSQ